MEEEEVIDAIPVPVNSGQKSRDVQSSYVPGDKSTPAPSAKKASPKAGRLQGPQTPITDESSMRTPGSTGRRKAAENAITKLHNEVMPDLMLWNKEKHRKRLVEAPSPAEEERRKAEKRKSEEKENHLDAPMQKKVKKEKVESKEAKTETAAGKITLLVTGASQDFLNPASVKVGPL